MSPQEFIDKTSLAAQQIEKSTGIFPSFTIAQSALESGWGERAAGNNLFGIKADASWHGPVVAVSTHEFVNGQRVAVTANFRAYPSWGASMADHAKFLCENERYKPAFSCKTCVDFAKAIQAAGYATDPNYASIIDSIVQTHNLEQFDV